MFRELEDYGWHLSRDYPFEYSAKYGCIWLHFHHTAFPETSLSVEIEFTGLNTKTTLMVSDDNCDGAGDSMDVLTQHKLDADEIWKVCEKVMTERKGEQIC